MFTSAWNNFSGGLLWLILLRIYMSEWFSPLFHEFSWLFMFIIFKKIHGATLHSWICQEVNIFFRSLAHHGFQMYGVLGALCMTSTGLRHAPRSLYWWQCHWDWDLWFLCCNAYSVNKWASSWENVSSGVSDQVRLKLACSATEASMMVDILVTETRDITQSRQRATKMLIRLCGCADWSAPLLFAYDIRHIFSWPGSLIFSCLLFYKRLNLFHAHKYF